MQSEDTLSFTDMIFFIIFNYSQSKAAVFQKPVAMPMHLHVSCSTADSGEIPDK